MIALPSVCRLPALRQGCAWPWPRRPSPTTSPTAQSRGDVILSYSSVVKKAQPAVVNVYASRTEKRPRNSLFDDPVFRHFFGDGNILAPVARPRRRLVPA